MHPDQLPAFPFTAVAGLQPFKLALLLAAVNPAIGGVLVSGPRGTAKSTLARGFAHILPAPSPFVTLPLGATEDMLVGTLDLQRVLAAQDVEFRPGLFARADGGVLYVDEVNLLPDALVDLLLDVAASGVNHVERDGISHQHAARFILLGTMNPDEGELRPQLLDRFGLAVELSNHYSLEERMSVVALRAAFERDPVGFAEGYASRQQALADQVLAARQGLPSMACGEGLRGEIAGRCDRAEVEGLRADIVWHRAAMAHAALRGSEQVEQQDIDAVEELVLAHRRKPACVEPPAAPPAGRSGVPQSASRPTEGDWGSMPPARQEVAEARSLPLDALSASPRAQPGGARSSALGAGGPAPGGGAVAVNSTARVDWFRSLLASGRDWPPRQLRFKKQPSGTPRLHLVLLDTSASTLRGECFAGAKALVLGLARQAYLARERMAILGFGNKRVQCLLPARRPAHSLRQFLNGIEAGGGTPLMEGLREGAAYRRRQLALEPALAVRCYLISDGKTTDACNHLPSLGDCVVVDLEPGRVKRGKCRQIARSLGASYVPLPG